MLHAWYIIAKLPEPPYEYESVPQDREGGRVTYVYVQAPQNQNQQPKPQDAPRAGGPHGMNYGTQNGSSSQQQGVTGAGEGSADDGVPPSYADVVAGDHKVQTQE